MSLHKSPLQILQSLTQKKFNEPKKEKTVFPAASDIYLGKNNTKPASTINNDIFSVKKSTIGSYTKAPNFDPNSNIISQSDPRAKSPTRFKRTIPKNNFTDFEKIVMLNTAEKPPIAFKSIVKDPIAVNNGDSSIMDRKTNDLGVDEVVKAKLELAYNDYQQEEYNLALSRLLKAEEYIEKTLNAQTQLSFGTIHLVLYNMISAEYKLRALGECKIYLNNAFLNCHVLKEQRSFKGILTNFKSIQEQSEYLKHVASKSLQKKYRCKMHLQACLIHSEIENHIEAYAHAKQASKLACQMLTDALIICYHLYLKSKNYNSSNYNTESSADLKSASQATQQQTCETEPDDKSDASPVSETQAQHIENMIPILEEMVCKIKGRKTFNGIDMHGNDSMKKKLLYELRKQFINMEVNNKIDMSKLYSNLPEKHFVFTTNIMGVAQIQPINPSEFNENWTIQDAIKPDTLVEQILLMVVSLYALSTELRFWDEAIKRETPQKLAASEVMTDYLPLSFLKRESQLWIGRSLEFAYTFLPHHCPIAEQIFSIYSKLYSPTKFMIPEDEEIKQFVKYITPAKGINRSTFFFIPIVRKCENEENDGIATLLFTEKELENSLSKAIKQIQLFDMQSKYSNILTKNYSATNNQQQRRNSRDTQVNFYNKINKLLSSEKQPQVNKSIHLRKTYLNKSPMPKEEKPSTSGSEFFIAEDKDQTSLSKENNSYMAKKLPLKRNSDSIQPQRFSANRPSSKGGQPQSEPKSPVVRKSKEKIDYTLPDANRRDSLVDKSATKEEKSKSFTETYNNSKIYFRPSSSGMTISSMENSKQSSVINNSKVNHSSTFYAAQNQEVSTVEDGSARKYSSDPSQVKEMSGQVRAQSANKRGVRPSPDGRVRMLNRRVNGNNAKEYFSQIEGSKVDNFMSNDKDSYESSMVVMTEPNERSTSQENERYVKKYIIPEKGPIRAMTSLRTRMKRDVRTTHTEGDEDIDAKLPGILDIYSIGNVNTRAGGESRVVNQPMDLMQALKKRSSSNGKRQTDKITILTLKKGKKGF